MVARLLIYPKSLMANKHKVSATQAQRVRIIGGRWRGRQLPVADVGGLRPTPDRVRETLFNWLQAYIEGAHCLDLFAGTGALGLEALSRGAQSVTLVETDRNAVSVLRQSIDSLQATDAQLVEADGVAWLRSASRPFDIVFLDPPFRQGLVMQCCELLEQQGWLAANALIYIEAESETGLPELPRHWQPLRSKTAGQVSYHLLQRQPLPVENQAD